MSAKSERWLPVLGWEGLYEVSDQGRVKSLHRVVEKSDGRKMTVKEKVLSPHANKMGYRHVILSGNGKHTTGHIRHLVLRAFVGPCPEGMEACHNNGNSSDDRLENLRWDTTRNNHLDKVKHGTHHESKKARCPRGHLLVEPNLVASLLNKNGGRTCISCARARSRVSKNPLLDFVTLSHDYYDKLGIEELEREDS